MQSDLKYIRLFEDWETPEDWDETPSREDLSASGMELGIRDGIHTLKPYEVKVAETDEHIIWRVWIKPGWMDLPPRIRGMWRGEEDWYDMDPYDLIEIKIVCDRVSGKEDTLEELGITVTYQHESGTVKFLTCTWRGPTGFSDWSELSRILRAPIRGIDRNWSLSANIM